MNDIDKIQEYVAVTINGQQISAGATLSVIEALWHTGNTRIKGVGCLEGVCGSCRILVRRANRSKVTMELACQTYVEKGMHVIFPPFPPSALRSYQLTDIKNSQEIELQFQHLFPEVNQCRSCGGCTESCPKGINVEQGMHLAAKGQFRETGELFIECIMCDLCQTACPEFIDPQYVGLFSRRVTAFFHLQPANLMHRLEQLQQGHLTVVEPTSTALPEQNNGST